MNQKLLELLDEKSQPIGQVFVELSSNDLGHNFGQDKILKGIFGLRFFKREGDPAKDVAHAELRLLSAATATYISGDGFAETGHVVFSDLVLRSYLFEKDARTAIARAEIRGPRPLGDPRDIYFQQAGDDENHSRALFQWHRKDEDKGHYESTLGKDMPGMPVDGGQGETALLIQSVKNEAFADSPTKQLESRLSQVRSYQSWPQALRCLLRQPHWAGGEAFNLGKAGEVEPGKVAVTVLMWNHFATDESEVAARISEPGLAGWWNETVAELLFTALRTVRAGEHASCVPRLTTTGTASEKDAAVAQLRFHCAATHPFQMPAGSVTAEYTGLRTPNGDALPAKGLELGTREMEMHGMKAHDGEPVRIRGDVAVHTDFAIDTKNRDFCFWRLEVTGIHIPAAQQVRIGAIDLRFKNDAAENARTMTVIVQRYWADRGGAGQTFFFDDSHRLTRQGPSIATLQRLEAKLPLEQVMPGGQDELLADQGLLESPFTDQANAATTVTDMAGRVFEREQPLVLPLAASGPAAAEELWLKVQETSAEFANHESRFMVKSRSADASKAFDRGVVIDMQPFAVHEVTTLHAGANGAFSADEGNDVAIWSSSGREGASWQIANPRFLLRFQAQAVAEATEKWLSHPTSTPGSAGTIPEDGPDLSKDEIADMRLGSPAEVEIVSSFFEQNFGEPGWNLRRLMGDVGQREPGVKVLKMQVELLYGLLTRITYPHLRLAEMSTRLGEVPAQIPGTLFGRDISALPADLGTAFEKLKQEWARHFFSYLSRLGVFEPSDALDARDELKKRNGILLTEGVVFEARRTDPNNTTDGLPNTPRLRYPVGKAALSTTPKQLMPSRAAHADDATAPLAGKEAGMPGGFHWGFESVAIYEELWENSKSSSAELAQLALTALGGYGKVKARFANDKTIIQGHVGMGRTHYYTLERVGRIAVFWVRAKHVIVYERSVIPSQQQADYQDGHLGRPVLRKVKEYIEILEPEKSLPDQGGLPEECGPVRGIVFHDRVIPVHGSWGHDVYADERRLSFVGWEIPLWRQEGVDPGIYPKPHISLRCPKDSTDTAQHYHADVANPQDLWFYTDTRSGSTSDVMSWPPIYRVDYADTSVPPTYLEDQEFAASGKALEGDLEDPVAVAPGLERYTFQFDRTEQKANLTADRTDKGQISAILRNVTMMRASSVALPEGEGPAKALGKAAQLVTALDGAFKRAADSIATGTFTTPATIKGEIVSKLDRAFKLANELKHGLATTGVPAAAICKKPLVYRFVEQPLRDQIASRRKALNDAIGEELFGPWKALLQRFDGTAHASLAEARAHVLASVNSCVERLRSRTLTATGLVRLLLTLPRQQCDARIEQGREIIRDWLEGLRHTTLQVDPTEPEVTAWLTKARLLMVDGLEKADKTFMREVGTFIKPFLETTDPVGGAPNAWALLLKKRDLLLTELKQLIDAALAAAQAPGANFQQIKKDAAAAIADFRDSLVQDAPARTSFLTQVKTQLASSLDEVAGQADAKLKAIENFAATASAWVESELKPIITTAGTTMEEFAVRLLALAQELTSTFRTQFDAVVAQLWKDVNAAADQVIAGVCKIEASVFALDLSDAEAKLKEWLQLGGEWAQRVDDLIAAYGQDAKALARALEQTAGRFADDIRDVSGKVQQAIAAEQRIKSAVGDLAQKASTQVRAFRAFCESPDIFPVKLNRKHIALVIREGRKALDMTPVVSRFNEVKDALGQGKDALGALGLRLPSRELLDRIIPVKLDQFDISRVFSDLGGIRFDDFLPDLKMPSISDENIKVKHGFDKETLRAWVRADADVNMPSPATLFSIGPVAVTLKSANFSAHVDMDAGVDGSVSKNARGAVRGDWELAIGGSDIVTFEDTALTFENGRLRFNLQPAKVRLNAVLKMISDLLPDMGGDDEGTDDGPGLSIGLSTIEAPAGSGIKIPSGVNVKLDLPLPDLSAGTFAITGLQLGAFFRLRALTENFEFDFRIATGFNLGRKTSPFNLTIFILGGGGWIDVTADYAPKSNQLSTTVSIGINASAILAINLGVVSGSVGIYLGVYAEFTMSSTVPTALTVGVFVMVRGEVDLLGIISVYLMLMLEAIYQKDGAGSRLLGRGTIELRIKICWCFTLSVRKSITYQLAGAPRDSGGGQARVSKTSKPSNFEKIHAASDRQEKLMA